jgi:hypothetical protein
VPLLIVVASLLVWAPIVARLTLARLASSWRGLCSCFVSTSAISFTHPGTVAVAWTLGWRCVATA